MSPDTLRVLEAKSIRAFVESCADRFGGVVLDYGCGTNPYRDIVEQAGGTYVGADSPAFPSHVPGGEFRDLVPTLGQPGTRVQADTVLFTQVAQYVPAATLWSLLYEWRRMLHPHGALVMTYPTNWPEVEDTDLHRFTRAGMTKLLTETGYAIVRHERRGEIEWRGERFALGYGAVAEAS